MNTEILELTNWEAEELSHDEMTEFSEIIFAWCGIGCGGAKETE